MDYSTSCVTPRILSMSADAKAKDINEDRYNQQTIVGHSDSDRVNKIGSSRSVTGHLLLLNRSPIYIV